VVDHGVQYFTLRDPVLRAEVQKLCGDRLKSLPNPILLAGQDGQIYREGEERFYLGEGNNRLGAILADGILVRKETEIQRIEKVGKKWRVLAEEYDAVVSSCPWPQTASLLGKKIATTGYDACLTVLLEYMVPREDSTGSTAYARMDATGRDPLAWTACENVKTGRIAAGSTVYVIQASPDYSRDHLEQSPEYWASDLQVLLEKLWHLDPEKRGSVFAHRWRYARRQEGQEPPPDLPAGIYHCGDSVCESRLESVWKSGWETARRILG
jgi:predicted NAD/FAD-dependent oxidoreductase